MSFPSDGFPEIAAVAVVVGLTFAARWVFRPSRPYRRIERMDATDARELGLLTVIATTDRRQAADQRGRLAQAGIRASTSLRKDGRYDLLVFTQDVDRARDLLG
jgi:hypothetical protein